MSTTITIQDLVDILIEQDDNLIHMFIEFIDDCLDPYRMSRYEVTESFENFFGVSEIKYDRKVYSEIMELSRSWNKVCSIFHHDLYEYNLDMGDEMSDLFYPLIEERIKKFIDFGLTTKDYSTPNHVYPTSNTIIQFGDYV